MEIWLLDSLEDIMNGKVWRGALESARDTHFRNLNSEHLMIALGNCVLWTFNAIIVRNVVRAAIAITKQWCNNRSDEVIVTLKYQSKAWDITWYDSNRVLLHLCNLGNIGLLFQKVFYNMADATWPCFCTMMLLLNCRAGIVGKGD